MARWFLTHSAEGDADESRGDIHTDVPTGTSSHLSSPYSLPPSSSSKSDVVARGRDSKGGRAREGGRGKGGEGEVYDTAARLLQTSFVERDREREREREEASSLARDSSMPTATIAKETPIAAKETVTAEKETARRTTSAAPSSWATPSPCAAPSSASKLPPRQISTAAQETSTAAKETPIEAKETSVAAKETTRRTSSASVDTHSSSASVDTHSLVARVSPRQTSPTPSELRGPSPHRSLLLLC